jgi:23S rRNA pseudouridine2605 synthase
LLKDKKLTEFHQGIAAIIFTIPNFVLNQQFIQYCNSFTFNFGKFALMENQADKQNTTRLNKYIANAGICSRREADKLISSGKVSVNGKTITEMGFKVMPTDQVSYKGKLIRAEKPVYLMLNKPKGYVTTLDDPQNRRTVMDLIGNACPERIYPVGRLDMDTTGLLLFTNDGELTKQLTHPSYNKKKIYHVELDMPASQEQMDKIAKGIQLEDGPINADEIAFLDKSYKAIGIEIHSGRNRIVRRIFEHFGFTVVKLDRVYFAGLTKKNLPRGKYRFLTQKELSILKTGKYE